MYNINFYEMQREQKYPIKFICQSPGCEKTTTCTFCILHKPHDIPCTYERDGQRCQTLSMQEFCAKHRPETIKKRKEYYTNVVKAKRDAIPDRILKKRGRPAKVQD